MKTDFKLLSFLLRGKRRQAVLQALDKPKTPKDIAKDCKISISNVSNALAELVQKKLVKCNNPEDHLYKFYELTETGKKAVKAVLEYESKK